MGIWVVHFLGLWKEGYKYFVGEHLCIFLLDIHLGEEGLGHGIGQVLMAIYEQFNKDSLQTYIHTKILAGR